MAQVALSLGSNIDAAANVRQALQALQSRYGELGVSPVYESEAVGFDGANFLNLVVTLETAEPLASLAAELKALEARQGRDRSAGSFAARTLDVDILTYDDLSGQFAGLQLPRPEISRYAFVLRPLADLLPQQRHPVTGRTYWSLWQEFQRQHGDDQRLWPVDFQWTEDSGHKPEEAGTKPG